MENYVNFYFLYAQTLQKDTKINDLVNVVTDDFVVSNGQVTGDIFRLGGYLRQTTKNRYRLSRFVM